MNECIWSIYKITNIINNKIYIGQTKKPKARWSRHKSNARLNKKYNYHLYEAMRKYGIDNFMFEIIIQTKYIKEVDNLEILLIEQYQSTNRNIGYNNSPGGYLNRLVSVETRQKLSKSLKGKPSSMLGKSQSNEAKKLISLANKGNKFRLGVITSDETKKLLSQINTGKKATKITKNKMSQSMIGKNKGPKNGMFGTPSEKTPLAKLKTIQAIEIRKEYSDGGTSSLKLAKKYGVSKKTILNILHNKIYLDDKNNE